MQYKVLSRNACERYSEQKHNNTSAIISIKSSWDKELPKLTYNATNNVKDILFLSFDDIEEYHCLTCGSYTGLIDETDAGKIVDFCNKWYNKVDLLIVHCDGGISRSTGVCSAIMRWYEVNDAKYFINNSKKPNMTCYLRVLDAFRGINGISLSRYGKQ